MKKTIVIALVITILTAQCAVTTQRVNAAPKIIVVPRDFFTITTAVASAADGDTIFVESGTYVESVNIDKALMLKGENMLTTIVDGNNLGPTFLIKHDNVNLTGFNVRNVYPALPVTSSPNRLAGIHLGSAHNCNVYGNIMTGTGKGIWLYDSANNNIYNNTLSTNNYGVKVDFSSNNDFSDNTVEDGYFGIYLDGSSGNVLRGNCMQNNTVNFGVSGPYPTDYLNDIDTSNLVNGKRIYYLQDKHNQAINPASHPDIGFLAMVNCSNMTIQGLALTQNYMGIALVNTPNTKIIGNTIVNDLRGIWLKWSDDCAINQNYVGNCSEGILVESSQMTLITGNTVIGCTSIYNPAAIPQQTAKGIALANSNQNTVVWNILTENEIGINLDTSSRNLIMRNDITAGTRGIYLSKSLENTLALNNMTSCSADGVGIWYGSDSTSVIGNNMLNIGYHDIFQDASSNSSIIGNLLDAKQIGIRLDGFGTFAGQSTITANTIMNTRWAGVEVYASNGNIFSKNNFLNNTLSVKDGWDNSLEWVSTNTWDNGAVGNFWSVYSGIDQNGDGIGDTPYFVVQADQDRYPLMSTFDIVTAIPPLPTLPSPPPTTSPTSIPTNSPAPSTPPSLTSSPTPSPVLPTSQAPSPSQSSTPSPSPSSIIQPISTHRQQTLNLPVELAFAGVTVIIIVAVIAAILSIRRQKMVHQQKT